VRKGRKDRKDRKDRKGRKGGGPVLLGRLPASAE
jgi:hypothetical protein